MSGYCALPCGETTLGSRSSQRVPRLTHMCGDSTHSYDKDESYICQTVNRSSAYKHHLSLPLGVSQISSVCPRSPVVTSDVVVSAGLCDMQCASRPRDPGEHKSSNVNVPLLFPAGAAYSPCGRGAQQQKTNDPRPHGFVSAAANHEWHGIRLKMTLKYVNKMISSCLRSTQLLLSHHYANKFHCGDDTRVIGYSSESRSRANILLLFWCILLLSAICPAYSRPSKHLIRASQYGNHDDYNDQYGTPPDSTTYLSKYGYLPKSDMETGALRNRSELIKAVKKFQVMAHITVTGELDEATVTMMAKSRCGVSDDIRSYSADQGKNRGKRYVLGPSTWPHRELTYRYMNYSPDLSNRDLRDALQRAFRVWSDVTTLTFREVSTGVSDMEIKFSRMYHHDGYPFDGQGMTLAHAFFPGEDTGGDVHFDEDEHWTVHSEEGVNLFMVAAHELGHAIGLGHSSVLGSLMYPWYQGYSPHFKLHDDDLIAIQYLYGTGDSRPNPTTTSERPHPPTPTPNVQVPPAFTTRPPVRPTTPNWGPDVPPDPCTTDIDAAAVIRQEVYMFKGLWFWRIDDKGMMDGYPAKVDRFWYNFPSDVKQFDAIYERIDDGKIIFFSGSRFWIFGGNHMDPGFPRSGKPLTEMGFPRDIEKVDAAFVWGYNAMTYLITDNMYWRYNENLRRMDYDYPRDMSMWEGVPTPVSAAFKAWDGVTYFIQGSSFWRFKDIVMRVEMREPTPLGPYWLECRELITDGTTAAAAFIKHLNVLLSFTLILHICHSWL